MKRKQLMSLQFKPIWLVGSLLATSILFSGCGKKGPLNLPQSSLIETSLIAPHHSTHQLS